MLKTTGLRVKLGRRLRDLRKQRGLSLEALGERSTVGEKYIQSVETAKQAATVDTLEKLALGLGIDPVDLFTFAEAKRETDAEMKKRIVRVLDTADARDLRQLVRVIEAVMKL